jgi:hypothetical protein
MRTCEDEESLFEGIEEHVARIEDLQGAGPRRCNKWTGSLRATLCEMNYQIQWTAGVRTQVQRKDSNWHLTSRYNILVLSEPGGAPRVWHIRLSIHSWWYVRLHAMCPNA